MQTNCNEIADMIEKSGLHRLLICSELKISLAMLDDFISGRIKMPPELFNKLKAFVENK